MRTIKAANAPRKGKSKVPVRLYPRNDERERSTSGRGSGFRGPKTAEGKHRSSINAQRHGLLSRGVVLGDVEFSAIEEMVSSVSRMRRLWSIEKHLLDKTIDAAVNHKPRTTDPVDDEGTRIAAAPSALASGPELHLLGRYEARLHRMYQRGSGISCSPRNTASSRRERKRFELPVSPGYNPEAAAALPAFSGFLESGTLPPVAPPRPRYRPLHLCYGNRNRRSPPYPPILPPKSTNYQTNQNFKNPL